MMDKTIKSATQHYLQSKEWASAYKNSPWNIEVIAWNSKNIIVYTRKTLLGLVVHIPGFVLAPEDVENFTNMIKKHFSRAITCKFEPCVPNDQKLALSFEKAGSNKGRPSQYAFTVQLDLTQPIEVLRTRMKKRARNEINRARNNGVQIAEQSPTSDNLEIMFNLLKQTAGRKQFSIHNKDFTFTYWQAMVKANRLRLFFAFYDGQIIAAAVILVSPDHKKAWYKEGASNTSNAGFNAPRYLLWEIMQALKKDGTEMFDLGGIPDPSTFEQSSMRGIYIFKTAYTSDTTKMMNTYELPLSGWRYRVWPKLELFLRKYAQKNQTNWY